MKILKIFMMGLAVVVTERSMASPCGAVCESTYKVPGETYDEKSYKVCMESCAEKKYKRHQETRDEAHHGGKAKDDG